MASVPSHYWAAEAVLAKRDLRRQGWKFVPLGLEATRLYQNQRVINPSGMIIGEMHSKTIAILFREGFFNKQAVQ